ncbi:hypothetical protein POM88_050658 [Heracleum sosnowskyi]|uniref:Uncharacterized protein n=1 Tax=Heracleum sosnowskyi TaxID=360622 RepID=A0AAD8H0H0_9APIA|nr:hypothetical protein POM88_050658 [Heracleum sosnowskyi]
MERVPHTCAENMSSFIDLGLPCCIQSKSWGKYKLHPGCGLEEKFGAVALYKGQGRLTGFQKSRWVDVDLFILGEEYRKNGFTIGMLYSASTYHDLKLFKQLSLSSV